MYNLVPATPRNLQPRYNIAPTTQIGVVTQAGNDLTYSEMRWSLVPSWFKDSIKKAPFGHNARAEGVATSGMFKVPLQRQRCLIPATGFFEWTGQKGDKLPWFISAKDGRPLTFAGIYDRWRDRETGDEITSCAIITCDANSFMRGIHTRMPVILQEKNWREWLAEPRIDLLKPAPGDDLQAWRVSTNVNSSRYQGDDTMQPIAEIGTLV
ncbi:SOS response-associated peptidase [Brucella anthropi]|nr:SOS response-associated peptidase [Brucella anthropi]